MSQLMSGGDKGANNPLAKLSQQFSADRGAQRVSSSDGLHPQLVSFNAGLSIRAHPFLLLARYRFAQDIYGSSQAGPSRQVRPWSICHHLQIK
jgi:hypothetical protein